VAGQHKTKIFYAVSTQILDITDVVIDWILLVARVKDKILISSTLSSMWFTPHYFFIGAVSAWRDL
jgi:hypothetical protein